MLWVCLGKPPVRHSEPASGLDRVGICVRKDNERCTHLDRCEPRAPVGRMVSARLCVGLCSKPGWAHKDAQSWYGRPKGSIPHGACVNPCALTGGLWPA